MDFLQNCLEERGEALVYELAVAGFSEYQTAIFLQAAVPVIFKSSQDSEATLPIKDLLKNPADLIGSLDIEEISRNQGLHRDQVTTGFEVIAPIFYEFYLLSNGGLVNSVVSLIARSYR